MFHAHTYLTVKQLAAKHSAFTEASIRWLRFNEDSNGYRPAFRTVGRKVLVVEEEFFRIIDEQHRRGTLS